MSANDIIGYIAEHNVLRGIIKNIAKNSNDEDLIDLEQDIYMTLLLKSPETIEELYDKQQLKYYLTRLVINNINSKTSRWYYLYKKNKAKQISMDEYQEQTRETED